jgi:hypothetical protein
MRTTFPFGAVATPLPCCPPPLHIRSSRDNDIRHPTIPRNHVFSSTDASKPPSHVIKTTLHDNLTQNILAWADEIVNTAALIGPTLHVCGSAYVVASDYKWGTMRQNIVPEVLHVPAVAEVRNRAGDVTTVGAAEVLHAPAAVAPRPTHPEPPRPAAADNPTVHNFHSFMCPLCVLETECKADLIKILKASLGPERTLELKDAGFAELDISPREIVKARVMLLKSHL